MDTYSLQCLVKFSMLLSKFSCSASITRLANCCACCATSHPTIKSPQDQKSNKQIAQPWKHWTILIFLDSVKSPSYDTGMQVHKPAPKDSCRAPLLHGSLYKTPKPESVTEWKNCLQYIRGFLKATSNSQSTLLNKVPNIVISVVCLLSLQCDSNSQTVTNIQLGQNKNMYEIAEKSLQ